MRYKLLGSTGLHVSCLGYGAQNFGGGDHPLFGLLGGISTADAGRMIGRLLDAGVNLIDTADSYADGDAEAVLGAALGSRRDEAILCTKAGNRFGPGPNQVGLSRVHMMESLEASLRRLRTGHVDLYYLHNFDPLTRIDDALRTLDDMVRHGKVRYVGCSNFAAWQMMKALGKAEARRLEPFVCTQNYYSLAGRDIEREIVPLAVDQGLSIIAWGALAGGFLTGKFSRDGKPGDGSRRLRFDFPPIDVDRGHATVDVAREIADRHDATVAQIALAWMIAKPFITSALFGARNLTQLEDNLKAVEIELSAEEMGALDTVSALPSEYPQWLFDRPMARTPGDPRDWVKTLIKEG